MSLVSSAAYNVSMNLSSEKSCSFIRLESFIKKACKIAAEAAFVTHPVLQIQSYTASTGTHVYILNVL